VPTFGGLYAPYWRQDVWGIIAGLTAYNTEAHIASAASEAAAFQTSEVVHAVLSSDSEPHQLSAIRHPQNDGQRRSHRQQLEQPADAIPKRIVGHFAGI
jgi:glycerol kinase